MDEGGGETACRRFAVQYTHQKLKKQKTWQDGTLTVRAGARRATLADESARVLDSVMLPTSFEGTPDEELESDRFRESSFFLSVSTYAQVHHLHVLKQTQTHSHQNRQYLEWQHNQQQQQHSCNNTSTTTAACCSTPQHLPTAVPRPAPRNTASRRAIANSCEKRICTRHNSCAPPTATAEETVSPVSLWFVSLFPFIVTSPQCVSCHCFFNGWGQKQNVMCCWGFPMTPNALGFFGSTS